MAKYPGYLKHKRRLERKRREKKMLREVERNLDGNPWQNFGTAAHWKFTQNPTPNFPPAIQTLRSFLEEKEKEK